MHYNFGEFILSLDIKIVGSLVCPLFDPGHYSLKGKPAIIKNVCSAIVDLSLYVFFCKRTDFTKQITLLGIHFIKLSHHTELESKQKNFIDFSLQLNFLKITTSQLNMAPQSLLFIALYQNRTYFLNKTLLEHHLGQTWFLFCRWTL